jgi:hypothetical protein
MNDRTDLPSGGLHQLYVMLEEGVQLSNLRAEKLILST